jgi:hypothetical protein
MIELVIRCLPTKKSTRSKGFTAIFYQIFNDELIEILLTKSKCEKTMEPFLTYFTRPLFFDTKPNKDTIIKKKTTIQYLC